MGRYLYHLSIILLGISGCQPAGQQQPTTHPDAKGLAFQMVEGLNEAIIQDGFSPPVASRIYAYTSLALYEGITYGTPAHEKYCGVFNDYCPNIDIQYSEGANSHYISMVSFCRVAKSLTYRDFFVDSIMQQLERNYFSTLPAGTKEISTRIGDAIAEQIISYSRQDRYQETRSYPLFELSPIPGHWQPTTPHYSTPLEPHWGSIRPFIIKKTEDFAIRSAVPYDTTPGSQFYKHAYDIYQNGSITDSANASLAMYWDGDPAPSKRYRRLTITKRQLNPVGHWLEIGKVFCIKNKFTAEQNAEVILLMAAGNADGLIACWYNKYKTDVVRPVSYINRYIDPLWIPSLITPPFPEYPSGHSTISGISAGILIHFFGDTTAFCDSSQVRFGFEPRCFASISAAARDCAESRKYGGVHYDPAVKDGVALGNTIAQAHIAQYNRYQKAKMDRGLPELFFEWLFNQKPENR